MGQDDTYTQHQYRTTDIIETGCKLVQDGIFLSHLKIIFPDWSCVCETEIISIADKYTTTIWRFTQHTWIDITKALN
jgi:hypothetical protein